ncbi:GntR family transcriptional regulator [Roseomonas hellenica]|uniref:GntR family transcriptional regulator n=1 Tax=Plastoroseomonas hellenica TaxID=2687306 RepID=A0ABS5ES98_9PROT|nr:GntR family transcriptional regulator [Plastoroseomonas hellenica]MBR0663159.1 GntR family transcriptional regulator [Plastoroseomonas hellenica]
MVGHSVRKEREAGGDSPPLYRTVIDALRQEILSGARAIGEKLPTEDALCRRFGVSRHTIREALRQLREEGLVASRQGAGTTVVRRAAPPLYTSSIASVEELLQYATEARYEVDKSGLVTADAALAARLGCSVGQRWLRVEGFRTVAGQEAPICWTEVFVLSDYAGIGLMIGRRSGTIYSWIEEMYGVRIGEVQQVLRAEPMPEAIAAELACAPGSMAIGIRRAYRLANGELVEVAFNLHPADRFTYALTLQRQG